METKKNIGNYLGKDTNRYFKIPAYQRGYKWGELNAEQECDASLLVEDILQAMRNNKAEYFIQGVTVYENGSDIVLIDGQQRTTTLFLLLHLLLSLEEVDQYLFFNNAFKLKYEIREKTQSYLKAICQGSPEGHETQDEFMLNQALVNMKSKVPADEKEKEKLKKYVLEKVQLFYIKIPEKHATQTFSMLNGAKASMRTDELVKSAFLSEAAKPRIRNLKSHSLSETIENLKSQIGEEWQTTTLRSQYARQWDKWMYWWNQEEVKAFFYCGDNPMGRLLEYYFQYNRGEDSKAVYSNDPKKVASIFKKFQNRFIKDTPSAKKNFDQLRKLQKTFEDIYNNSFTHNYLGLALTVHDSKEYMRVIGYFIQNFKKHDELKRYTLLSIMGISESNMLKDDVIEETISDVLSLMSLADVYNNSDAKEYAFKVLLLLNVLASNDRQVKFEFFYRDKNKLTPFYAHRSLEHIWPKSKVVYQKGDLEPQLYTIDEKEHETIADLGKEGHLINRRDFRSAYSEHCIGNLLLLHKQDNSAFNAKLPEAKKLVYFNLETPVYSRNLLHTMSAFAVGNWSQDRAIRNIESLKDSTLSKLKEIYNYDG